MSEKAVPTTLGIAMNQRMIAPRSVRFTMSFSTGRSGS